MSGDLPIPRGVYDMEEMECDPGRYLELKASRVEAKAISYSNGSDEAERNPWVQPIQYVEDRPSRVITALLCCQYNEQGNGLLELYIIRGGSMWYIF